VDSGQAIEEYSNWYTYWYPRGMAMTTIKIPVELRDRINEDARAQGVSAAGLIEQLMDAHDRNRRMQSFGRAVRSADEDYWNEAREWDALVSEDSGDE